MIIPVILAGGVGSRLWPLSRAQHPKQFQPLVTSEPLLIDTARRIPTAAPFAPALIITNEQHRFAVAAAFKHAKLPHQGIVLEPEARSTAPAAAVAAHLALKKAGPEAMVLLMPADHYIDQPELFLAAVAKGRQAAQKGALVTFGVKPSRPETGYGYLRTNGACLAEGVFGVAQFVEKPDGPTAEAFCADPSYLWNAGIFLFRADAYLAELEALEPDMAKACAKAVAEATLDLDFVRLSKAFCDSPANSIDYAVMEKTTHAAAVPLEAGWSDVGTWDALYTAATKDEAGNAVRGDAVISNAAGCYVRADHGMVAISEVEDLVVVTTKDATLVTKRARSGSVKNIVEKLAGTRRNEVDHHVAVHRPWGHYETLHLSERYQVKQIVVEPGAALSLQRHHHRAEHWIVVKGTARVTVNEEVTLLSENQSIYVPLGAVHRLENPGLIPLILIEVQSGSYLGEDDIVRLEDVYARV